MRFCLCLQQHIESAAEAMEQSVEVCDRFRKKSSVMESLGKMVKRTNYDKLTEGEKKLWTLFISSCHQDTKVFTLLLMLRNILSGCCLLFSAFARM